MTAPRLLHIGSAVVDHVYRLDALPEAGSEKVAASYAQVVGGGFNMMVAAARTGMAVAFAGQHGTGPNGDALRAALAAEKIATLTPPSREMDTGNCVVMITADAERTFVSWPGAEGRVTPAMLAAVSPSTGDWAFISGYTLSYPGSREALGDWIAALPRPTPFVFDPAPVVADIPAPILERVLARADWLSCNAAEAAFLAGKGDAAAMAARLLARCPAARGVVVRLGAQGCFVHPAGAGGRMVEGFSVEAVDTNGAGDTHIGAFVSALAHGQDPFEAARYANAAAAISVTRHGGASAPADAEIRDFIARSGGAADRRHAADG
ncbi:ribokinase [Aquamicrobium terrae]